MTNFFEKLKNKLLLFSKKNNTKKNKSIIRQKLEIFLSWKDNFLRINKDPFILFLIIINLITLGFLAYNISLIDYSMEPRAVIGWQQGSPRLRNRIEKMIYYAPQYFVYYTFHPINIHFILFLMNWAVIGVLIINLFFVYHYYKWYIFVYGSKSKKVFWFLLFVISTLLFAKFLIFINEEFKDIIFECYKHESYKITAYFSAVYIFIWGIIIIYVFNLGEYKPRPKRDIHK